MAIVEMLFIVGILIWGITHPDMEYIQYSAAMMPSAKDMLVALRALM